MRTKSRNNEPRLTPAQIQKGVFKRLKKYEYLNLFEHFAMFMGIAQILEASLKGILAERYRYDPESMEKWTLGRVTGELRKSGLRADFITLVDGVVTYRNHVAHEFLANEIMLRKILGGTAGRLELKRLERGTYELEQVMLLHEWCERHDAWD